MTDWGKETTSSSLNPTNICCWKNSPHPKATLDYSLLQLSLPGSVGRACCNMGYGCMRCFLVHIDPEWKDQKITCQCMFFCGLVCLTGPPPRLYKEIGRVKVIKLNPPSEILWNSLPKVRAMDFAMLVLPTPGGPEKQRIGPVSCGLSFRTLDGIIGVRYFSFMYHYWASPS